MEELNSRPTLYKAEWQGRRKYGQYEFSEFPRTFDDIAFVGGKLIGNIQVDCRLMFNESKWGVLTSGGEIHPAGIIRMDISFGQVKDYKLTWATVQVTLDGEHKGLEDFRDRSIRASDHLVCMTHWYGPDEINGTTMPVSEQPRMQATPKISAQGIGLGGMGISNDKSFEHNVFWTFKGRLQHRQGKGSKSMTYDSLKWDLKENNFETQSSHGDKFQTAFAFVNSGQPFLMKIEIHGGLHKVSHRIKKKVGGIAKMIRFGGGCSKEENISTTLVRGFTGKRQPLDEVVRSLNDEMKAKNRRTASLGSTATPSDTSPPAYEESQPTEEDMEDANVEDDGEADQSEDITEQALKDMIQTYLLADGNGNASLVSPKPKESSGVVVDETADSLKEVVATPTKIPIENFLFQIRLIWQWLLYCIFGRDTG